MQLKVDGGCAVILSVGSCANELQLLSILMKVYSQQDTTPRYLKNFGSIAVLSLEGKYHRQQNKCYLQRCQFVRKTAVKLTATLCNEI